MPPSLESLPEEVICNIGARLDVSDLLSLRLTSHTMGNKSEFALKTHHNITHRWHLFNFEELLRLQKLSEHPLFSQRITHLRFDASDYVYDGDDIRDMENCMLMAKDEALYKQTSMHTDLLTSILSNLRSLKSIGLSDDEDSDYGTRHRRMRPVWSSWRLCALLTALKASDSKLDTLGLYDGLRFTAWNPEGTEEPSKWYLQGLENVRSLSLTAHYEPSGLDGSDRGATQEHVAFNHFSDILSAAKNINELLLSYKCFSPHISERFDKNLDTMEHLSGLSSLCLVGLEGRHDDFKITEQTLCSILRKLKTSLISLELTTCRLRYRGWLNVFDLIKNQMSLQRLIFRDNAFNSSTDRSWFGFMAVCFDWPGATWSGEDCICLHESIDPAMEDWDWTIVHWIQPISKGDDIEELVKEKGVDKVLDDMIAGYVEVPWNPHQEYIPQKWRTVASYKTRLGGGFDRS
ncbi:uncharacterized protein K452DRAFT_304380 [Aplosporella prunicola CBS 121167]|uniref:F-box domain-containing protein n=1 Tax=Aplosporella prunicola CBS 121167 TaxID=1176127 RepID=A0A6A6BTY2_9PEZI|nr:uncharacterized protein K452DRAFT_304380 [Aplosporella prunicola CBS 121167]KAF2147572.1 hypothetical protein K452DRAFT_304380 [Aplosporella prunicola CBS 121167]